MSETLKELRELPLQELIRRHDEKARTTEVGVAHYLQEIARRDDVRLTKTITFLTAVILVLTLANVVIVFWLSRQ